VDEGNGDKLYLMGRCARLFANQVWVETGLGEGRKDKQGDRPSAGSQLAPAFARLRPSNFRCAGQYLGKGRPQAGRHGGIETLQLGHGCGINAV
jgi:hypothetical protein